LGSAASSFSWRHPNQGMPFSARSQFPPRPRGRGTRPPAVALTAAPASA